MGQNLADLEKAWLEAAACSLEGRKMLSNHKLGELPTQKCLSPAQFYLFSDILSSAATHSHLSSLDLTDSIKRGGRDRELWGMDPAQACEAHH
jgi:hypothetical protein